MKAQLQYQDSLLPPQSIYMSRLITITPKDPEALCPKHHLAFTIDKLWIFKISKVKAEEI